MTESWPYILYFGLLLLVFLLQVAVYVGLVYGLYRAIIRWGWKAVLLCVAIPQGIFLCVAMLNPHIP